MKYSQNLTWNQIANILNRELDQDDTANKYRKEYYRLAEKPVVYDTMTNPESSDFSAEIDSSYTRIRDEKNYVRSMYRRMSREQTLKDIARETAEIFNQKLPIINPSSSRNANLIEKQEVVGTLLLSDWHYGIEINNPFNEYNPEIFKERLDLLLDKTIEQIDIFNIKQLNVLNLGDLISGRIHSQIRINNRYDVITQVIEVSEYLAEFIADLSKICKCKIDYYDCYDNHSRIEPNLSESLQLENLTRIIHWFLQERLKDNKNISIHENRFGPDIITLDIFDKFKVAAVHGNNDKQDRVIDNISMMTRQSYDMICSAHFHHFSMDEKNECILVSNPSLMGTDEFSEKLRLTSKPAQTLIVSTEENVAQCIVRLVVD